MSLELIANTDLEITFSKNVGPALTPPSAKVSLGTEVVATESVKCKAGGKSICTEIVTIIWTIAAPCPFTSATHDFAAGAAVMLPTAIKTKAEGKLVFREGDTALPAGCIGSWTLKVNPAIVAPCQCGVEITTAGQTKVKAQ